jgi:hypothetical protein
MAVKRSVNGGEIMKISGKRSAMAMAIGVKQCRMCETKSGGENSAAYVSEKSEIMAKLASALAAKKKRRNEKSKRKAKKAKAEIISVITQHQCRGEMAKAKWPAENGERLKRIRKK